ncbi:MAG: hypothetical protein MR987_06235 [Oscillospiraceae bacterium]|nr:hypothetical protein [Oscillospiraceae bacterium]
MLKKTAAAFLTVLMLITLCSCSGGWKEDYEELLDKAVGKVDLAKGIESSDTETQLRERLAEYGDGNIIWFSFDDFDEDGTYEAFAFVGKAGAEYMDGVLWYVNENYAAELKESGKWHTPEIVNANGTNFLFAENYDDGLTYVFGIENSKVYETAVSGSFSHLTYMGGRDFTAEFTSYDYYEDEEKAKQEDPTTKIYWFYLENGEFHEYGADDTLRRANLREYPTGSAVIDEIYQNGLTEGLINMYYPNADEETLNTIADEAGYFQSIMLRENGIINLNFYGAYEDCFYITFKINGSDVEIIDQGRGFYLPAAVEAIATYPVSEAKNG